MLEKLREPVNGITHLGAAVASAAGLIFLVIAGRGGALKQISLLIYGLSLVMLFSASAAYHLIRAKPGAGFTLRNIDHAAIYILIAGTYTPICINRFTGFWQWGLLAIIWALALAGIIARILIDEMPRWLSASLYLVMGWLCLAAIKQMLLFMPVPSLIWLLAGGLFFSFGAVIYAFKILDFVPDVFGYHEVWHVFVILGCFSHYLAILNLARPG